VDSSCTTKIHTGNCRRLDKDGLYVVDGIVRVVFLEYRIASSRFYNLGFKEKISLTALLPNATRSSNDARPTQEAMSSVGRRPSCASDVGTCRVDELAFRRLRASSRSFLVFILCRECDGRYGGGWSKDSSAPFTSATCDIVLLGDTRHKYQRVHLR